MVGGVLATLLVLSAVGVAAGGWLVAAAHRRDRAAVEALRTSTQQALARADELSLLTPAAQADLRAELEQKLAQFEVHLRRRPHDLDLRADYGRALSRLGRAIAVSHAIELEELRSRLEQARAVFAEIAAADPARLDIQKELADASTDLAVLSVSRSGGDGAEVNFRDAIERRRQILQQAPADYETLAKLRADLVALGEFLEFRHDLRSAEERYREALGVVQAILDEFADAASSYGDRGGTLLHLATLLAADQPTEADRLFRTAIDDFDFLTSQTLGDPESPRASRLNPVSPSAAGPRNLIASLTSSANKNLGKVTSFYAALAARHPGEAVYLHLEARYQFYEAMVGFVGRTADSDTSLRRCLDLYQQLLTAHPDEMIYAVEAARTRMTTGRLRLGSGQAFAAATWVEPAVPLLNAWRARLPDNKRLKWLLAEIYVSAPGHAWAWIVPSRPPTIGKKGSP